MRRALLLALAPLAVAAAAHAQPADPHAGHQMPPAQPPASQPSDPHAGHKMPAPTAPPDPHAGHRTPAPGEPGVGAEAPPPVPTDHAADRIFPAADMAAARETLRREHGDVHWPMVMVETADYSPSNDSYGWRARASWGGDINRILLKTEGEGESGDLEHAEAQALYSRAVTRYVNLHAGVRQDFEPRPRRTYATVAVEGLAPYWFDVEAALFLSDRGDVLGRLEGSYDLRLTQRVILEPRAEANFAAQDVPELDTGSGLTDLELGLRLRYAIRPEFAPYVGVAWKRSFGDTTDFARAAGHDVEDTRFLLGLRAWF